MTGMMTAGFSDPVHQSQAAFRGLLSALSEPGTIRTLSEAVAPPQGLCTAAATALLTLADYETPIWLPERLRDGEAGAWLRFHCGATLVSEPAEAVFAVLAAEAGEPALASFAAGTDLFPDRSATVIVQCSALEGGEPVRLSGPGIATERGIAPAGLRPGFWREFATNAELYPLGIDIVLACGDAVIGLPRSTQVTEAR